MKSKIESLQVLRAFAALSVVINHLWGECDTRFTQRFELNIIGSFGVDAFFILSGFIMCYKTPGDEKFGLSAGIKFLKRRFERIYPVFLIILAPVLFMYLKHTHPVSFYQVVGNIFLLPSFTSSTRYHMLVGPSWSLVYEMFFYIIYAVAMVVVKNKKQLVTYSVSFLVMMVLMVNGLSLRGPELGMANFSYMIGDPLMINFAMGCLYAQLFTRVQQVKIPLGIAAPLALGFFILGMCLADKGYSRFIAFGLPAMAIVIIFSLMASSGSAFYRLFVYMGDASYSIYITHFLTQTCVMMLFAHWSKNRDLYGIIFSTLSVIIACLFYSLIEKKIMQAMQKGALPVEAQRQY